MTQDLSRLLHPKTIALFGGAWAGNVLSQLVKAGFEGEIWPVHPTRETLHGYKCYSDISQLPSAPDASFIGVNRQLTIEIVSTLRDMDAGGATCFASGFLESESEASGGADLQAQLIKAAGGMPILGPNCYGFLNYIDNIPLWPDQHGGIQVDNGVAIIGQSSNVLINITMQKRGLPISYVVAAGNQAQTQISDIALHLMESPKVTVIGLYIEGFGNIQGLEKMASRARELGKTIVAIKTGKSEKSQATTLSHTASLAGSAVASSALMKRLGIIEVNSIAVFIETLKLLHVCGPLEGNSVSSMSCSGGEAGLIADMAENSLINFRGFSSEHYNAVKDVLGPLVTVTNPLDYHTFIWNDEEKLYQCYKAVLEDNFDLNILIMDLPHDARCEWSAWEGPMRAIKRAAKDTGANVAMLATLPENLNETIARDLMEAGIAPMNGMDEMIAAIESAIKAGQTNASAPSPVLYKMQHGNVTSLTLNEVQSKNALANFGVCFPLNITVQNISEITDACAKLSFPCVLKGIGIAHKTEAGAVTLNLKTPDELIDAASLMPPCEGYLIEEMVPHAIAELLIGITRDPTGIFVLTIGAGGVLTELISDSASLIIPATRDDVLAAIKPLKIFKILDGYRGQASANIESILDAIEAAQAYALENTDLIELDINPLMALPDKAIAVDALIVKEAQ